MNILISWIGNTDLLSALENEPGRNGPIGQALLEGSFNRAILLDNYRDDRVPRFQQWLLSLTSIEAEIITATLSSPTDHKEIYEAARNCVNAVQQAFPDASLTFHLSPGTPAMAFVWMLLAPVYGAKLIESSLVKGVQTVQLPFAIAASFLPDAEITRLTQSTAPSHPAFVEIQGNSPAMREAIRRAQHVAPRNVTVLIDGESGTGKELFARAIHGSSQRSNGPFIAVNCGAIPPDLLEASLFGYKKGAFTGAINNKNGFFQAAEKGTLFLDELGELSASAQVKLLRALQERAVTPVGGTDAEPVDVRIIAATHKNLLQEVAEGRFRSDLFYRLAVALLHLPPLRQREGDIALLLEAALAKANAELGGHGKPMHKIFSDSAKKIMLSHPWPGNVRELYNTVMRAVLWSPGTVIDEESAQQALLAPQAGHTHLLERPLGHGFSLESLLAEVAYHYIARAETESDGTLKDASDLLGFKNYQTYAGWKKRYGKL